MNNNDDMILSTALDQPLDSDNSIVMQKVDDIIEQARDERNVVLVINAVKSLRNIAKVSGQALAVLLYKIKLHWDEFGTDEPFETEMVRSTGLHPTTVTNYVRIAKAYLEGGVPPEFIPKMQNRSIQDMVPIANALEQGYEISPENWEDIANASDFHTIAAIVRDDIKKQDVRPAGMLIFVDDKGSLWAWKNNERYYIGVLKIDDAHEVVQNAIARIIKRTGVFNL